MARIIFVDSYESGGVNSRNEEFKNRLDELLHSAENIN